MGVSKILVVFYPLIPKGVEHNRIGESAGRSLLVFHPLMPKGVEHQDNKASLKKGISLIRKSWLIGGPGGRFNRKNVNRRDWPVHVGYYGLRGGKLAKVPYEKCVELFRKARSKP